MTALDAYTVVAYLCDEPAADAVEPIITQPTVVSALNLAEVVDRLMRIHNWEPDDLYSTLAILERAGMRVLPVTVDLAVDAGLLRARYYHRRTSDVSMADCVAAATALREKVPLATSDPALVAVMQAEGGEVHALPDSKGSMP